MMRGMEHLLYKGRLRGDLITAYKLLKHERQVSEGRFFLAANNNRTRGNWHKLEHGKLHTNTMKNLFTVKVTEHWHRLPRGIVEIFKSHVNIVLGNLF